MSKKHDAIFDDVLSGLPEQKPQVRGTDRSGARFLKRSSALADRADGALEEKTLRWVDPGDCRMWEKHNRNYGLLTEANCKDLIDGLKSQGRQEFPAIVRKTGEADTPYEVICGARRHFAVSWLRANNYPQFQYLIDVREMSDEEAFRLADIENRDREDISDYERAVDYAKALDSYYEGKQKAMAERLEVSEGWLSRYLTLAKMPSPVVAAFAEITEIKESHARALKPLLARPADRDAVLAAAAELEEIQISARRGEGAPIEAPKVLAQLKAAVAQPKRKRPEKVYRVEAGAEGMTLKRSGRKMALEFPATISRRELEAAWDAFLADTFPK